MRVALDTNVLAYAEGVGDKPRVQRALSLVEALEPASVLLVNADSILTPTPPK